MPCNKRLLKAFHISTNLDPSISESFPTDKFRQHFGPFRTLAEKVPWERVLKGKEYPAFLDPFKNEVFKAQEQAVLMCLKMNQWGRKPAWVNRALLVGLWK